MNEEKQQKFTAKVRRGLIWVHSVASAELAKKKAEATGVRIEGFTASELADVARPSVRRGGERGAPRPKAPIGACEACEVLRS